MNDPILNDIGQNFVLQKDAKNENNYGLTTIHQYVSDKYPPDLDFARRHGKAKRVAKAILNSEGDIAQSSSVQIDVCECCGLPIENEQLPLCCDRTDLAEFGSGYPLYFEFVFYCIIMLVIMFLTQGLYALISNLKADQCQSYNDYVTCDEVINQISISNKLDSQDLYKTQTWVNLGAIILIMASLHKFRRVQKLTENECDRGLVSPSDYTILINNLPPGKYNEKDIERLIMEKVPSSSEKGTGIVIKKIVMGYKISDFVDNCKKLKAVELKIRNAKAFQLKNSRLPEKVDLNACEEESTNLKKAIGDFKNEIADEKNMCDKTCGDVFVTFATQNMAQEILERYELSSLRKYWNYFRRIFCCDNSSNDNKLHFRGELVYVQRAPEPNDIIWENLGFSNLFKFKRRFMTNLASLMVLAVCFALIFGISWYQSEQAENYAKSDKKYWVKLLGYFSSFLIVFINTCLLLSIRMFASVEKSSTITHLNISVGVKLAFAQFCNTAIITFLANYVIYKSQSNDNIHALFKDGGLVTDLYSIFLSNSFIPIIMTFCNPWYAIRLYKRHKVVKEGEHSFVTQAEANEIFEGGPLDMAYKYGILVKTMWFASFYSSILPIGTLFSLLNIILTYLLDKYLILRRYARTPLLSADLNKAMIECLEYCPFFMALGSFFFHLIIYSPEPNDKIVDIIAMALTCVNFIFPASEFNDYFCKTEEEKSDQTPYDEAMRRFATDYDRANPITQEKAMIEWVNMVEGGSSSPVFTEIQRKKTLEGKYGNALQNYAHGNMGEYNNLMQKMLMRNMKKDRKSKEFQLPIFNSQHGGAAQKSENPPPQGPNPNYPDLNQGGYNPQAPGFYPPQTNIFGQTGQPTSNMKMATNIYGQPIQPPAQQQTNIFGQISPPAQNYNYPPNYGGNNNYQNQNPFNNYGGNNNNF